MTWLEAHGDTEWLEWSDHCGMVCSFYTVGGRGAGERTFYTPQRAHSVIFTLLRRGARLQYMIFRHDLHRSAQCFRAFL
jgi:hypothetical protein